MREKLTDLQLLCDPHHDIADREREKRSREAYEQAGEEAMDAAGMNTYFTKIYGRNWADHFFASGIASADEEWDEWKQRKTEEDMAITSYFELVDERAAKEYWSIKPATDDRKIVSIA